MDNESQYLRQRAAKWCSRASLALLLLALASGMFLASGVSATARGVLELLACLALATTVAEMMFAGQWRIVRSRLWFVPLALVLLPLVQLGVAGLGVRLGGAAPWRGPGGDIAAPWATVESAYLFGACLFLFAVATAQLRSPARLGFVTGALALVLMVSGIAGPLAAEPCPTGTMLATAPWGMAGHQPWTAVSETKLAGELAWFAPGDGSKPRAGFAGFWSRQQWAACAVALVPVLGFLGARLARRASERTGGAWYRDAKGQLAIPTWAAATILAGLTTYVLSGVALVALALGLASATLLSPDCWRRPVARVTGDCLVAALLGCLFSLSGSGSVTVTETMRQCLSDDASLARMFWDHRAIGCGLGAGAEVWSWYRVDAPDVPFAGSALLAFAAESGLLGVGILVAALVLSARSLRAAKGSLDGEVGLVALGLVAGLAGLVALGTLGPGLEAPVALALGVVLLGALARGLAVLPKGACAP